MKKKEKKNHKYDCFSQHSTQIVVDTITHCLRKNIAFIAHDKR